MNPKQFTSSKQRKYAKFYHKCEWHSKIFRQLKFENNWEKDINWVKHSKMPNFPPDSANSLHVQIEAMKLAFADAYRYIADPASMDVSPNQLLDKNYLAERAKLIDLGKANFPHFGLL